MSLGMRLVLTLTLSSTRKSLDTRLVNNCERKTWHKATCSFCTYQNHNVQLCCTKSAQETSLTTRFDESHYTKSGGHVNGQLARPVLIKISSISVV